MKFKPCLAEPEFTSGKDNLFCSQPIILQNGMANQCIRTLNSIYSQTYERSINEWKIYLVTWYTAIVINCSFCRKFRLYYVFRAIKISKFSTAGIFRVKLWEVLIFFLLVMNHRKLYITQSSRYPRLEA